MPPISGTTGIVAASYQNLIAIKFWSALEVATSSSNYHSCTESAAICQGTCEDAETARSGVQRADPVLPRCAKLDETQQGIILAPERALAPDEIAVCDCLRSLGQAGDELTAKYAAEREAMLSDAMLQDVADKGFLTEAREKTL